MVEKPAPVKPDTDPETIELRKQIAALFADYTIKRRLLFKKAAEYLGEADALAEFAPYDNVPSAAQDAMHERVVLYAEPVRSGLSMAEFIRQRFGAERDTTEFQRIEQQLVRGKNEAEADTREVVPVEVEGGVIYRVTEPPPKPAQKGGTAQWRRPETG
jgi:hypothetical protein